MRYRTPIASTNPVGIPSFPRPPRICTCCLPAIYGQPEPEPEKIRQLLNRLTIYYSWIVLDLGRLNQRSMALIESVPEVMVATSTTLSSLHEARRAVAAIRGSGWGGDNLGLAVSELPGNQRLSEAAVEEMVGLPASLHLPDSSADMEGLRTAEGLPKENSNYREQVARMARTVTGTPEEKPTTKRLAEMLGWR
jgi:Flp pilus assembly CpaE family ATPase